ncbi:MAG: hypothetical protein A2X94_05465 [Bdellovibrionales bacterium GWB1_55_8]|nr:MAG: hypothetical protein A2X94_05465 [Bdellovibrionales bacterium GWB1_55_8]
MKKILLSALSFGAAFLLAPGSVWSEPSHRVSDGYGPLKDIAEPKVSPGVLPAEVSRELGKSDGYSDVDLLIEKQMAGRAAAPSEEEGPKKDAYELTPDLNLSDGSSGGL